jgi:hypothetical protein
VLADGKLQRGTGGAVEKWVSKFLNGQLRRNGYDRFGQCGSRQHQMHQQVSEALAKIKYGSSKK